MFFIFFQFTLRFFSDTKVSRFVKINGPRGVADDMKKHKEIWRVDSVF